jgi:hypothetical protein
MISVKDMIDGLPPAKKQFVLWLQHANPKLFQHAVAQAGKKVTMSVPSGMGATTSTATAPASSSFWDSLTNTLSSIGTAASTIVPTVLNAQTNQKILDAQIKLAQAGKPPLNTSQITAPPTASFSIGTSPAMQYIMWGALGLGAVFLFMKLKK